jgi:hypothetical protein
MPRLMNCTRRSVSTRINQSPVPAAMICNISCDARSASCARACSLMSMATPTMRCTLPAASRTTQGESSSVT